MLTGSYSSMAAQSCSCSFSTSLLLRQARAFFSVASGMGLESGLSAPAAFRYSFLRASLKISAMRFPSLTALPPAIGIEKRRRLDPCRPLVAEDADRERLAVV